MEQVTLDKVNENVEDLKRLVKEMMEIFLENQLELSDDVLAEIEASKNASSKDFTPHKDIVAEFLK
jgi:hypothetical protein